MDGAFRGDAGGILSLDVLVEGHQEAVESDLIDRGLRLRHLGSASFNWNDLRAIITCARPDSALARSIHPDEWQWQLNEILLAEIVDMQHLLWWAKTTAGHEGRNRPKRWPRPGIQDDAERYGNDPVSIQEMNQFLGWDAAA